MCGTQSAYTYKLLTRTVDGDLTLVIHSEWPLRADDFDIRWGNSGEAEIRMWPMPYALLKQKDNRWLRVHSREDTGSVLKDVSQLDAQMIGEFTTGPGVFALRC